MQTFKSSTVVETGEKVVVIVDSYVGKTSLVKRYVENIFENSFHPTIGYEQYNKTETVDGEQVKLAFWDTAGQERFNALLHIFFSGARCVVFVFDLTSPESLTKFEKYYQQIIQFTSDDVPVVLLGNKCDLIE